MRADAASDGRSMRQRCAILGFGRIGRRIAGHLADGDGPVLVGIMAREADGTPDGARFCRDIEGLLALAPDIVVECASAATLADLGPRILAAGADLVPLSLAAFADPAAARRLEAAAEAGPGRIELPSGAAGALGLIAAAKAAGLSRLLFRQAYPPALWRGTAAEAMLDLGAVRARTVIFTGTAREAARHFPRNLNAATGVALAGPGLDATEIELIADPALPAPAYALEIEAGAGPIRLELGPCIPAEDANGPDYTAYSVLALLRRRTARIAA